MQPGFIIEVLSGPALCYYSHFIQLLSVEQPIVEGKVRNTTLFSPALWRTNYYFRKL